jgi:D-3-phosphoglycerate dehydrogenase
VEAIVGCSGVLVRTAPMSPEVLSAGPNVRVVSRHGAGVDNVDLDYCRLNGIRVTYAPEANTTAVAEHTVGLIVAAAKNMRSCDGSARRGQFAVRNTDYGIELAGKTLGVVGLGRIGRLVGRKMARAFDMRVIGSDPYLASAEQDLDGIARTSLDELLDRADVVSVHAPLTPETRHLIGAEQFKRMRAGAYLVNCARGGVVDEEALVASLEAGHLAGAALDVFETEPLPADHPLTAMENVLLTPHMAAHTQESLDRMASDAADGIVAVLQGREPRWSIV